MNRSMVFFLIIGFFPGPLLFSAVAQAESTRAKLSPHLQMLISDNTDLVETAKAARSFKDRTRIHRTDGGYVDALSGVIRRRLRHMWSAGAVCSGQRGYGGHPAQYVGDDRQPSKCHSD